jgi:hypothetical protein
MIKDKVANRSTGLGLHRGDRSRFTALQFRLGETVGQSRFVRLAIRLTVRFGRLSLSRLLNNALRSGLVLLRRRAGCQRSEARNRSVGFRVVSLDNVARDDAALARDETVHRRLDTVSKRRVPLLALEVQSATVEALIVSSGGGI